MRFQILLLALCTTLAAPIQAQEKQRLEQRSQLLGFEAIGRLESSKGYCTGTLIARDQVLTAAHCLYDKQRRQIPADKLRFRAAYRDGAALATRRISRYAIHKDYRQLPNGKISGKTMPYDLALLQLNSPIHIHGINPLGLMNATDHAKNVTLISYGRHRSQALTREANCTIKTRYQDGLFAFTCDATFGSSGAPVMAREDGRMRILSVVSAIGIDTAGAKETLGMSLHQRLPELKHQLRAKTPGIKPNPGGHSLRAHQRKEPGGAKFLRVPGS